LTPCAVAGTVPRELCGGQYVRNGGNPTTHPGLGRDSHWFDGDGMLSGVVFSRRADGGDDDDDDDEERVVPQFVNQFILTDLFLSKQTTAVTSAIMPSIATLINPMSSLLQITLQILRTLFLVLLSHLPGSQHAIKRISVANTAILFHDGRVLASCESGPPMRVQLPDLATVGWYDGLRAEGEPLNAQSKCETGFGGSDPLSFMKEWTTGHPKVDPITHEMILYHNTLMTPYVHYSVIQSEEAKAKGQSSIVNEPVSGVSGAKMMHDFGVSRRHTLIMDLPLSLDPLNLMKNKPVVSYDSSEPSRFGIFPRHDPSDVRWFATSSCCIFHTANMWDTVSDSDEDASVNLLTCRMTSATVVYSAGNITPPYDEITNVMRAEDTFNESLSHASQRYEKAPILESPYPQTSPDTTSTDSFSLNASDHEADQCRLYYYEFNLSHPQQNEISYQWALSSIPFEFPSVRADREMQQARYVYGCSTISSSFGAALGRAVKIDVIAKIDTENLIRKGKEMHIPSVTGCVDTRSVQQIINDNDIAHDRNEKDAIQLFKLPQNHFAQEPRFVARSDSEMEDSGYLLFYVFDETQLLPSGECPVSCTSELWILDAENMRDVVAKVQLPQRVPYGLHGNWFSEEDIAGQRAVERFRSLEISERRKRGLSGDGTVIEKLWMRARGFLERAAG